MRQEEFDFFISYGSNSPVTVTVFKKNGSRPSADEGSVAIGSSIEGLFTEAFKKLFGRQATIEEHRLFMGRVRQMESLQAQPQNVGL